MSHPVSALPRSAGSISGRRPRQPWPTDQEFRILALDGGGIRGVFSAAVLAALESAFCHGRSIAGHFDLITGTSTGGIIALGLAAGKTAAEIRDLYRCRGTEIFPPYPDTWLGRRRRAFSHSAFGLGLFRYRYDRTALEKIVTEFLGERTLGDASHRLIIPLVDGTHGEIGTFKNRFHPQYSRDHLKTMVEAALATSAAPTIFTAYDKDGMRYLDGGIWANNPAMLAVLEALISFDVPLERIKLLSIGCGDEPFRVNDGMAGKRWIGGGIWDWKGVFGAAMAFQSMAATNQARLVLGTESVIRIEPKLIGPAIELDDYRRAVNEMLPLVGDVISTFGSKVAATFLETPAEPFVPVP